MLSFLSLLLVPAVLAHNISLSNPFKRDGGKTFSNYYAGESEGACGGWNTDSQFVVALTTLEWNNGANCYKDVYITWQGKSATAQIVDECMGCPWDGLDFSQSLFSHFVGEGNNEAVGIIYGDWSYGSGPSGGDGGDNSGDTTTTTKATTTKAKPTTTTSKRTTTSTTPTTSATPTTSKAASKSSAPSSASAAASKSAAASSASASATPTQAAGPQNLGQFSQAILNLSGLILQGPQAV
ncbi:hypothetical protein B0H10DRAFT_2042860 [Mycena sp. CBHHK59/15]|nr:hypothetical protein B0H10DRAFT_2042860 [Mycena sp. CBHHK59/15]